MSLKLRLAAASLGTLALGALAAAPASAGNLYLYAEKNYLAKIGTFWSAMNTPHNMSTNANNTLSSFDNQTAFSVAFWHDANGKGGCFTGKPNSKVSAFAWWDDNAVSSFQIGRAC